MKEIRKILADLKRADQDFNLINENDTIVVGVSGGKDSLLLALTLSIYQKFAQKNFSLIAVTIDLGFEQFNPAPMIEFFEKHGIEYHIEEARNVYPILKSYQEEHQSKHLPCSICSRMKKATINQAAHKYGANKVAFAHHVDDALETLVMNQIHGGRIATFAPKMFLEREKITFIRPFAYVHEKAIIKAAKALNLPVSISACPADKQTNREEIKQLLNKIYQTYPSAKNNLVKMLTNYSQFDLWFNKLTYQTSLPQLNIKPVTTAEDKTNVLYIRMKVFVEEQNIPIDEEITPDEFDWTYLLIMEDEQPIGTIRYQIKENNTAFFGRFAILKEYRSKGYGKAVLTWLEKQLNEKYHPLTIKVHGQAYLKDYYLKMGYKTDGVLFFDADIPHYHFEKTLS